MKKLLLLLLPLAANAQISLTDQHFPDGNELFIFSTLNDASIDYQTTGANQSWDFSALTPTGQRGLQTNDIMQAGGLAQLMFGFLAPANYKAAYFNSTVDFPLTQLTSFLPVQIDGMNQYTRKDTDAVQTVGYEIISSGTGYAFRSDTIETRYALPMTFGSSYESRGSTSLDLNPIYDAQWRQHRHRVSEVDGWGTVTTPHGTFQALRIHHVVNETDSIYISYQGFGMWLPVTVPVAHEYEWRSTADKEAIMRIKTSEAAGNQAVTTVEYRDDYNGLGLGELSASVNVYPNPAVSELHVELDETCDQLSIIDATGKIVFTVRPDSAKTVLDISSLSKGSYQLVAVKGNSAKAIHFQKL